MADAPWRCSQCGTVNEPVANACRTCGRWPSLFDLESSTIESSVPPDEDEGFAAQTVDMDEPTVEPEPEVIAQPGEAELPPEFESEDEDDTVRRPSWQRFARLVVPIGVALYILISALLDRGG